MSTSVELLRPREAWAPPPAKPLDESVWQAWVAKGREQDRRDSAARIKVVQWISIVALLSGAGLWTNIAPYDLVVRFVVAGGAMILLLHAICVRQYALALVFGALVLLFNPVAPVFTFSGEWPRAVLVASALPFIASLVRRSVGRAHNC